MREQRHRQREKQAPCGVVPDVGLDPGSPGSRPGLQAALNRCATGAALFLLKSIFVIILAYTFAITLRLLTSSAFHIIYFFFLKS